jgi:hypothetical protein
VSNFAERVIGAATLNAKTYEEIKRDPEASTQALTVVFAYTIVSTMAIASQMRDEGAGARLLLYLLFWLQWLAHIGMVYFVGRGLAYVLRRGWHPTFATVLRSVSFSLVPIVFLPLIFIPVIAGYGLLFLGGWMALTWWVSVRVSFAYQGPLDAFAKAFVIVMVLGGILGLALGYY